MVNCLYHACIVVYFCTLSTNTIIIIIIIMLWSVVLDTAGQVTLSCLIVYHLGIIFFEQWCLDNLTESEINSIGSLLDVMFIREGNSVLPVHFELSALQITDIITFIVTN